MIAQLMHLAADGFLTRQLAVAVAELLDQLLADRGRGKAAVQTLGLEGGVGLALAIDQGFDVVQEVG